MTAIDRIQNFLDQHAQVEAERGTADEIYRINAIMGRPPGILLASDLRQVLAMAQAVAKFGQCQYAVSPRCTEHAVDDFDYLCRSHKAIVRPFMWQPETPDIRPAVTL